MPGSMVITVLYSLNEFMTQIDSGTCPPAIALDLSGGQPVDVGRQRRDINDLVTVLIAPNTRPLERLELDCRYGHLGDVGIELFRKLLASDNCPSSVLFDLRHNNITDEQAATLIVGLELARHTKIQLNLGHNLLSDLSALAFANLLIGRHCPLEALTLNGNNLSSVGAIALAEAL